MLIIFAKWPEPGKVKTRLAKRIGAEAAAKAYRTMVDAVIAQTEPEGAYLRILCYDPPEAKDNFRAWFPQIRLQYGQGPGDLGQRMATAFQECFRHGARHACIIGTDCVDIDTPLITNAYTQLAAYDAVIGPAADGGYYLLGMNRFDASLFDDIAWSTETVYQTTCQRIARLGWQVAQLPVLHDIDE